MKKNKVIRSNTTKKLEKFILYSAIFLFSATLLMVQIASVRSSVIAFKDYFVYIIIPIALSGLGFGALAVQFLQRFIRDEKKLLSYLSFIYTFLLAVSFLVPSKVLHDNANVVFFFLMFLAYLFAGAMLSIIFKVYSSDISKVYFLSLAGSSIGSFILILALKLFHLHGAILFVIIIAFFHSTLFLLSSIQKSRFVFSIAVILVIVFFATSIDSQNLFYITCPGNPLFSLSSPLSQIDVYTTDFYGIGKEWGINTTGNPNADYFFLKRDCRYPAGDSPSVRYSSFEDVQFFRKDIAYVPFQVKNYSNVLIIATGGGTDIDRALIAGNKNITAVEINPLYIETVNKIKKGAIDTYNHPYVNTIIAEGRMFITSSPYKYDLIFVTYVHTPFVGGSAFYTLVELYLFTEEAMSEYYKHLRNDGVFAILDTKILIDQDTSTLISSLRKNKIDIKNKIVLVEGKRKKVLLFKKDGFSYKDFSEMKKYLGGLGFSVVILGDDDLQYYESKYQKVTDDRPYFWNVYTISDIFSIKEKKDVFERFFAEDQLRFALILSFILVMLVIFIPSALSKDLRGNNWLVAYFAFIGIGFVAAEIVLIQRFSFFIGNPVISMATVLSAILLFGGIASYFSSRIPHEKILAFILATFFVIFMFSVLVMFSSTALFIFMANTSSLIRVMVSILLISIPAIPMGIMFPIGIRVAERISNKIIPWMVAIDGMAAMFGALLARVLGLFIGFNAALWAAVIMYAFAVFALSRSLRKS